MLVREKFEDATLPALKIKSHHELWDAGGLWELEKAAFPPALLTGQVRGPSLSAPFLLPAHCFLKVVHHFALRLSVFDAPTGLPCCMSLSPIALNISGGRN